MSDRLPQRDVDLLKERGLKCSLWGRDAKDMDRDELLAFVGFLDELATARAYGNATGRV